VPSGQNYAGRPIPLILGPTGVGKSGVSFNLAQRLGHAEIISADARSIFRGMDIGTDKPPKAWRDLVPHHLVDCCDPLETYSVMDFRIDATRIIYEIIERDSIPLVVGGSTLHIHALSGKFFEGPSANQELRDLLEAQPLEELHAELAEVDPEAADRIHPHDEQRIVRALEVYKMTGKPITQLQKESKPPPFEFTKIGLTCDRKVIHQRIDDRVDEMIEEGLVDEVKELHEKLIPGSQSYKSNGYKEIMKYLDGEWPIEEAIRKIKVNTHTHARRQFIFFKRFEDIHWIDTTNFDQEKIVDEIYHILT
jgi:tRNA dimethylallyltransferase